MQPLTSCLLAKINRPAFLKSWRADRRKYTWFGHVTQFSVYLLLLLDYIHQTCIHEMRLEHFYEPKRTYQPFFHHTYFMREHSIKFFFGDRDPFSVHTVHHHNDKLYREKDRNNNTYQQKEMSNRASMKCKLI